MENDAALPGENLFSASLGKVDAAKAYVGLISYRYGQTPEDAVHNPNKWSLTELEFRRAVERKIPICMFIMHDDHAIPRSAVGAEGDVAREKLNSFIALAKKDRIYAEFKSVDDLRAKSMQSLVKLREAIERHAVPDVPSVAPEGPRKTIDVPRGWEIVDRDALAKIRANPPALDIMVQFFDGVLPTWRLALAPGVQPRTISERLANRLRAVYNSASKPEIVLLAGAGGEGKSTALLHAAAMLVEDKQQTWTCLRRGAANEIQLAEDTFSKLEIKAEHAWVIAIDDADNVGPEVLAAVKKIATRRDVHLLLAARDADWQIRRLVPSEWQSVSRFHQEPLVGLTEADARRIVGGWKYWGDDAMGLLKGRSEEQAVASLLGHARDLATDRDKGELLGALLITRQGEDMRAHVRTLVEGLGRSAVFQGKPHTLRDIYAMVAAMHAENQLYLTRSVLAFALGCEVYELEDKALVPMRSEAMLDSGATYVLTRHRRIAEAACAVMLEDGDNIERWYSFLASAARRRYPATKQVTPEVGQWSLDLPEHFLDKGERWWPIARATAKALYDATPNEPQRVTFYSSILRRTGKLAEAMAVLRATGDRFRNRRNVMYEWSTVAGAAGDHGLGAWLGGRALADGEPFEPKTCKVALAGLGVAFRQLFLVSQIKAFAVAQAACGQIGLRLAAFNERDERNERYLQRYVEDGRRVGVGDLSPDQAVNAIRKGVILGADEVTSANDQLFFEKLLGEPDGYRYTSLLRMVMPPEGPLPMRRTKERPSGRR